MCLYRALCLKNAAVNNATLDSLCDEVNNGSDSHGSAADGGYGFGRNASLEGFPILFKDQVRECLYFGCYILTLLECVNELYYSFIVCVCFIATWMSFFYHSCVYQS